MFTTQAKVLFVTVVLVGAFGATSAVLLQEDHEIKTLENQPRTLVVAPTAQPTVEPTATPAATLKTKVTAMPVKVVPTVKK